jgi:hypothetical protein
VREGLWQLHPYEPGWLLAGVSFWGTLSREEVLAALEGRAALLRARMSGSRFAASGLDTATGTPEHIVELFTLHELQLRAELEWVGQVSDRIGEGAYGFSGEDPSRSRPREHPFKPPGSGPPK